MKFLLTIFGCTIMLMTGNATAGGWFDDFDAAALHADWTAADGKANGTLDSSRNHTTPPSTAPGQSLRVEQTPTESRPTRDVRSDDAGNPPTTGTVTVWFFDDGADIKAFDLQVSSGNDGTGTNKLAIGLRDATPSANTNYVITANGSTVDSGVARSTGWHLAEFSVHSTGAFARIDGKPSSVRPLAAMTVMYSFTVYTNFGAPTDTNQVWIDDVRFSLHGILSGTAAAHDWQTFE